MRSADRFVLTVLLAALVAFATVSFVADRPAHAQQPRPGETADDGESFLLTAPTPVNILAFVQMMAQSLNSIFIYNENDLRPLNVTLYAYRVEIPRGAFYNLLLALLKHVNYGISYYGEDTATNRRIYEIEKLDDLGRKVGIVPSSEGSSVREQVQSLQERAQFVTMVIHLEYADPASVQRALLNLVTRPGGTVQPITGVNAILVSDFEYQIRRMAELMYILDRPGPQLELAVIPLQNHPNAGDLVRTVGNLLQSRQRAQQRQGAGSAQDNEIFLESDARSNAIIVQALPENIRLVRQLISKLDIAIEGEVKGRIHHYFCKHTDAVQLGDILNQLIGTDVFTTDPTQPGQPGQPGQPQQPRFRPTEDEPTPPNVVADETTNSLIITATAEEYLEIRQVIEQLDIRKPQVMIEAAFIEIRSNDALEYGIELAEIDGPGPGEGIKFFGGSAFGFSDLVDSNGVPLSQGGTGLSGRSPAIGDGTRGGIFGLWQNSVFNIPVLVRALQTVSDVNVLSQPRLLTNDNEQAELRIEDEVPTTVSTTTTTSTDRTGFSGYETAGITLTVTPQISAEDYLRLEITITIDDFVGASTDPSLPPPKTSREYTGIITVPNGRTVVIGGMTRTDASKTITKIPILGDIPLLGELFRSTTITERKTNVYMFLRPVILRDPEFNDLRAMSIKELQDAQNRALRSNAAVEFFERAFTDADTFGYEDEGRSRRQYDFLGINGSDDEFKNGRHDPDDRFLPDDDFTRLRDNR